MHAPKHVNGTDTLVYLNQRQTIVLRASIPVPSHRDLAWSVPLAATAATLMAREAATEGAAVAQDAGGLSSTPYDPTGTLPELASSLATAPWEPNSKTLQSGRKGFTLCRLHDRIMVYQRNILSLRSRHRRTSNFVDWWPLRGGRHSFGHPCHPSSGGSWHLVVSTVPVHHEHSTLASRILNELNRVEVKRPVKTITTGRGFEPPREEVRSCQLLACGTGGFLNDS